MNEIAEAPKRRGRPPKQGLKPIEFDEVPAPFNPTITIEKITTLIAGKPQVCTEVTFTVENKSYSERVALTSRYWYLMFYSRAAAQIARG